MVSLSITVKNIDMKLNNSLSETKSTIEGILQVCKKYKIDDIDIKSSYINTGKEYYWDSIKNKEIFTGYSATQMTQIVIRDLQSLEAISSELLNLKITSMDNFVFDHSDRQKYEAEAGLLALDNAKTVAMKMTERMNVTLTQVQLISDSDDKSTNSRGYSVAGYSKALTTGIVASPGILTIEKNIQVMYGIK
jgi:uncharacterized protein YggE